MSHSRIIALAAVSGGLLLALAVPSAANAHVGIDPVSADAGAYRNVSFTAANESATAATIKVEITLPTDTPIVSVRYLPVPGWTTEVIEAELPEPVTVGENTITTAPSKVIFSAAEGNGIFPGQFQQWTVSLGPIPDTGQIVFPAVQTYDDGEVVNWTATAEEVEKDASLKAAPVLFVNDEPVAGHDAPEATDSAKTTETAPSSSDAGLAVGLGIAGLVLGALGLLVGGLAWIRSRSVTR